MLLQSLNSGGPIMGVLLAAWIVVFAGVIDRAFYAIGRTLRGTARRVRGRSRRGDAAGAAELVATEREAGQRGLARVDSVSQLATSIGLFGTVTGIAQSFIARGGTGDPAASLDGLATGLSTALSTTVAGLFVFLFGQASLIVYREWLAMSNRRLARALEVNA